MARGGRRQGTAGKAYSNRSDLATNYGTPKMGEVGTAASGGMTGPVSHGGTNPGPVQGPLVGADEVPNLSDPTMRPMEPVTAGVPIGPGSNSLGMPLPPSPADPVRQAVEALMLIAPNPDLSRIIAQLDHEGR